jgi:hypothetical protein
MPNPLYPNDYDCPNQEQAMAERNNRMVTNFRFTPYNRTRNDPPCDHVRHVFTTVRLSNFNWTFDGITKQVAQVLCGKSQI